jgi:tetratricopeptide (TPR) repeat protein
LKGSWRAALTPVLCLALVPNTTALAQQDARRLEQEYMALVEDYRSGQRDLSVVQLLTGQPDRWLALVDRFLNRGRTFVGGGSMPDAGFYRAASLMHAQASFRLWSGGDDEFASAHFNRARGLVDLSDRSGTTLPAFRPRWYLATTLLLTRLVLPEVAAAHFADASRRVPDDVPLLTAAGWFSEHRSDLPAAPGWSLRTAQARRRQYQEEATRFLTSALAVDPRTPEATLRLARLEGAMGRDEQAASRLKGLLTRTDLDRSLAYVAHLVLGGIHERQGARADAERFYREAIKLDPVAQSARVALAQLLYAAGGVAQAADILEPMLTAGDARDGNDPWSDYRLAYPSVGQRLFEDLVAEVQP